jgi:hypothetical protein
VTVQPGMILPPLGERGYVSVPAAVRAPAMPAGGATPDWWRDRLYAELQARQYDIELAQAYVDGNHRQPMLDDRASTAFRRIAGLAATNLCGLIQGTTAERLVVQGFRFGESTSGVAAQSADADAWRIWQENDFDAESELAVSAALTAARSFIMVEPARSPDAVPTMTVEDATQMVVAYAPGSRRERLAALKVFVDEWTGQRFATLLLPGTVHKWRSMDRQQAQLPGVVTVAPPQWELRDPGVEFEVNPLGIVPVFELRNRPRIDGTVRSEIFDVIADQDACNHIALNMLIAAEYGAFRQKWATGIDIPKDPTTGQPIEPDNVAVNRLLATPATEAKFGDFNVTDLRPYIDFYESRVKHMAAVSQTPVSVLLGAADNVAAEALALTISGHVAKVKNRAKHFEQAFEGAMRCAFLAMNDPRAFATTAETLWIDPEIHSWAEMGDMASKLVPDTVSAETFQEKYLGMSSTERDRDRARRSAANAQLQLAGILAGQNAPLPGDTTAPVGP